MESAPTKNSYNSSLGSHESGDDYKCRGILREWAIRKNARYKILPGREEYLGRKAKGKEIKTL